MTNAEVLIIIDHKGQRFVGGSQAILDMYNSGLIKPTQTDQKYAEDAVSTSAETNFTGVQPLENTPENLMLDHRLANVLGIHPQAKLPQEGVCLTAIVPVKRYHVPSKIFFK